MYAHVFVCHTDQQRASDPLELEYQALVSLLMWVLGTKSRSL